MALGPPRSDPGSLDEVGSSGSTCDHRRMADADPPVKGIVTGFIEPIKLEKVNFGNLREGDAAAIGYALRFPQFAHEPRLLPGTEARDFSGRVVPGTGIPEPEDVEVTDETLVNARDAAERALARKGKLTADALALAEAVCEYGDGRPGGLVKKGAARVVAIQMIASLSRRNQVDPDEVCVDLLNMSYAVLHYGNKERTE